MLKGFEFFWEWGGGFVFFIRDFWIFWKVVWKLYWLIGNLLLNILDGFSIFR
jgi:hypothetical protein